jgi:hypothetical protein
MAQYTLTVGGEPTDFARSTKATVIAEADRLRTKEKVRDAIGVVTAKGTEVYSLKEIKARVITKHTKPYTKTITLPDELAKLVLEGYVAAYERPRNDAVVLRNESAEEDERYAVTRRSTGEVVALVPTTRDAGQVMKEMKAKANA